MDEHTPEVVILEIGKYHFEPKSRKLSIDKTTVRLSHKESKLLEYFACHAGETMPRDEMVTALWGDYDYFKGRSMDVFISRLRKYLSLDTNIEIINTFGVGFCLSIRS